MLLVSAAQRAVLSILYEPDRTRMMVGEHVTSAKIRGFMALPVGWHFGEGVPASPTTASQAMHLNDEALRQSYRTDAFPAANGAIMVTARTDNLEYEMTIEPDGNVVVYVTCDGHEFEPERMPFDAALKLIRESGPEVE